MLSEKRTPFPRHIGQPECQGPQAKERGIDDNEKIIDRKRHVAVDSDGRLLLVNLTPANIADSVGAQAVLEGMKKNWPSIKHFFADGAYKRRQLMDKATYLDFIVEIVKGHPHQKGFEPLQNRWVVERTFGWMMRWRRLVRDYEKRLDISEAMIKISMVSQLLRRIVIP